MQLVFPYSFAYQLTVSNGLFHWSHEKVKSSLCAQAVLQWGSIISFTWVNLKMLSLFQVLLLLHRALSFLIRPTKDQLAHVQLPFWTTRCQKQCEIDIHDHYMSGSYMKLPFLSTRCQQACEIAIVDHYMSVVI